MRISSVLLPTALFLLASSAGAQSMPYPQADAEPDATVRVTGALKPVRIYDDQAQQIAGTYALSNGWRLKVNPSSHAIAATIDKQKPMRLFAVSPYKFSSRDGRVTMEFNRGDMGDEMVMSYAPDPRFAEMVVISSSVAQR
ncbi:hypothetical protein [Massilia sp. S19_KUP03_FR1]|uniref:hypothetical protein n=1 Tax=Massilia sp. S19_KUP03_FR1 TaxID=3025503 RepID=UPI002FCD10FF